MCKDIKDYITRDEPFGPIDTVDIDDDDVDILKSLCAFSKNILL